MTKASIAIGCAFVFIALIILNPAWAAFDSWIVAVAVAIVGGAVVTGVLYFIVGEFAEMRQRRKERRG